MQYYAPMIIERENLDSEDQNSAGDHGMISTVSLWQVINNFQQV